MAYPNDIFTSLDNNSDGALACYIGECIDPNGEIKADADPAELAAEHIEAYGNDRDWFQGMIEEHGREDVEDVLCQMFTAYTDEMARDLIISAAGDCACNDVDLSDLYNEMENTTGSEVDRDGDIHDARGHWVDNAGKVAFVAWVEAHHA
jgi:hypothetical protein